MTMLYLRRVLTAAVALAVAAPALAQTAQRLSDKDIKALFEAVDNSRDRFEDQLDGKLKGSIVRGPRGETNVGNYLQDLQDRIKRLPERFTDKYAASSEVAEVLKQGTDINTFVKSQPAGMKGASEWDRLAADLTRLAEAYNTTFPLPADAAVRRINDAEAAAAAEGLAKQFDVLKSELGKDKSIPQAERDALKKDLDAVKKEANVVKSRVSGGKPASAEARALSDAAARVNGQLSGRTLTPGAVAALSGMRSHLDKLRQAYGVATP